MNNSQEIYTALKTVRHPLSTSATLPPACYVDNQWLELERRTIFSAGWVCAGRHDRWRQSGDFVEMTVGATTLLVIRDTQGALRAFANSCRHRGSKLLSGSGQCKRIVCPFHAWSYDFDGTLLSAPRMETACGFDPGRHGLIEFRLGIVDGFVFICLDEQQQPLEDWLGDFSDIHQPWCLSDLVTTRTREFDVDCNWKLFIEVFNEYYHLPYVHPDSISHIYAEPDPADPVIGEYTTQFGVTSGSAALLDADREQCFPAGPGLEGRNASGTRYTWVYPNMTFAACFDSLWMYHAFPLAVDKCRVVQTVAFPRETVELDDFARRAASYYERIDTALAEDVPFLVRQQAGLNSPFARQGRFSALEPGVGNFACWYAETMCASAQVA